MSKRNLFILTLSLMAAACGGSSSSSSNNPTSPTPTDPGTLVSQNGCSATFACPNTDINGTPNPSTPTFDQLTLSTGTSDSCRAHDPSGNSQAIPIQFTIHNPGNPNKYWWRFHEQADNNTLNTNPSSQPAGSPGPFQATAFFGGVNHCQDCSNNFTQNLILEIVDVHPPNSNSFDPSVTVVAACGVTVWGVYQ